MFAAINDYDNHHPQHYCCPHHARILQLHPTKPSPSKEHSIAQSYSIMNLLRKRVGVITLAMLNFSIASVSYRVKQFLETVTRQDKTQEENMNHVAVLTCRSPRTKQRGPIMSNVAITINSRPLPPTNALGMLGQMLVSPMAPASPTCATPPTRLLWQVMIPLTVSPTCSPHFDCKRWNSS